MDNDNKKANLYVRAMHALKTKFSWEDGLFCLMILAVFIININLLAQLHQLPSPMYGGDYYNHLGSIEHIYQGGSVFASGQMIGEIQWVAWLYHLLVVIFAKLAGLSPMMGIIYFSLLAMIAGCTIIYLFISKFFNNKIFGLIAVLWHIAYFPIFKYTPFAFYVILPLFLFAAYCFLKKPNYISAVLFGVAYGLAGLSTTYVFIEGTFILGFMLFHFVFFKNISFGKEKKFSVDTKPLVHNLILATIVFAVGFAIALLWWFQPIFVYHAHTANDMQIYGFPEVKGIGGMIGLVRDGIRNEFSGFGLAGFKYNTATGLKHLLLLMGIACLFLLRKKKQEHIFIILLLIASFFGLLIHFITVPLLGTLLASTGLFQVGMLYGALLLALLTLEVILDYASDAKGWLKHIGTLILLFVILMLVTGYNQQMNNNQKDQWWNVGKTQIAPHLLETREWLLQNTNLDDVFVTTNEDGFALNAISGRKIITYRRTHASPYADLNQRMLDTGIILYTSNDDLRKSLIEKYSADYLYWEPNWLSNEFQIDQNGQIQGFFDPLSIDYSAERESALKEANVSFMRTTWYMDPAWLPSYPKRDLLIILPARPDYTQPWSPMLDSHLTLVKEITSNGQSITKIYKISTELVAVPVISNQVNATNSTLA